MSHIRTATKTTRLTVAAIVAVAASLAFAAASHARRDATASAARPTIVLIHGAWADGSSWASVTKRLQRAGYTVDVPPNPLRGLAFDSSYVASFLKTVHGPIVLAGHSYGGAVITDAATGNANVKALVYVDAYIPDQGESTLQLTGAKPGSTLADPPKAFDFVPYPGGPANDVDLYIKQSVFRADFAGDEPADVAALHAASQRPLAFSALQEKSTAPAWKTIPSWAVIGTEDRILPPAEQVVMTKRAHAKTTKVKAAHLSMVSQPDVITSVVLKAAAATR